MKTVTTLATPKRASSRKITRPDDLENLDWDFRIDPPPHEVRTIKVRFVQRGPEPFTCRPDPRD